MENEEMIVKCQKPLFGNAFVFVYNESRTLEVYIPYTPQWEKWFGPRLKRYALAHMDGTELVIDRICRDRSW